MKRITLGLIALLATAAALAQPVNRVPALGITDSQGVTFVDPEGSRATYSAVSTGLVPAASATDILCIAGASTKTIKVQYIEISGTAGTLVTLPAYIAKRATADTAGTPATSLALPVASKMDSLSGTSAATLVAYTANPTINDASPLLIRARTITLPVTTAGTSNASVVWRFGADGDQALVLRGAAQQACINLSGISVTSGLLNIALQWVEE